MVNRREVLKAVVYGSLLGPLYGISRYGIASYASPVNPFTLGVASGSPRESAVTLWTRLAPDPLNGGGLGNEAMEVEYKVSDQPDMSIVLLEGTTLADPEFAHSVHITIEGLIPGKEYWYQFSIGSHESRIGRTKTLDPKAKSTRLAIVSCQHYEHGFYAAHRDIAEWAPDCVVHLGDYIYEYASQPIGVVDIDFGLGSAIINNIRSHHGGETRTLWDYRNRHAQYKLDSDLQDSFASAPWLATLDDHELANNWASYTPYDQYDLRKETSLEFRARRIAALRAFYEHQPLEKPPQIEGLKSELIYNGTFQFGPVNLLIMDTRQNRTPHACEKKFPASPSCAELDDPSRTLTGIKQEKWLLDSISKSTSRFVALASQTWFSPYSFGETSTGKLLNMDQWDGYPVQRNRIVDRLSSCSSLPIVLSGDWHVAAAMNLHRDPNDVNSKLVGYEFATPSVSSAAPWGDLVENAAKYNKHVQYIDSRYRGYMRCYADTEKWTTQYRAVADITQRNSSIETRYEIAVG